MSKITQALEKASRERQQQRREERVVVPTKPVEIPVISPARVGLTEARAAGTIQVDPHLVSVADPSSPIAEQYRILGTNLLSLKLRPGPKVLVVTSSVHSEGKSVTAINLALTLARQERLRVLLVDADLRKGTLHHWLGLKDVRGGLSESLSRNGELNGSLIKLTDPPLTVLPAGKNVEHPAELLSSTSFRRLISAVRTQFDIVIIDVPPVLPVADPGIIAAQVDGVLFVVRAGKTQRKTAEEARGRLLQMQANVIGCVLTHVEHFLPGYYRYYQYYRAAANAENGGSVN